MIRTRIRSDQEQDLDFVSESELNTFMGKVVITGTVGGQDSEVIEDFDTFFPGRGLIIDQDNITVTTGTNFVMISGTALGVGTLNTLSGTVTLVGDRNAFVSTAGSTITIDTPFDEDDVDSITASGVTFTGTVNLSTVGGSSLIPNSGTNTITISGGRTVGEAVGNFFQVEFTGVGNINNTWLSVSSKDLASNLTPWVVVFPCRIAGMSYSNATVNSSIDIEIYIAPEGAGSADVLAFTHQIRDARTAWKSDFGESEFLLSAGDKVGLFARTVPGTTKPKDMFLGLYLEVVARASDDDYENFAGNF